MYHQAMTAAAAAAAASLQSCPTLCNPIDRSPPASPVLGILQARSLEWVAISFSNAWKWKVKVKWLSHVRLLATPWSVAHQAPLSMGLVTPWSVAHQAPLSMGFSRQEYWSGVPLPSPKRWLDLPRSRASTTVGSACMMGQNSEMIWSRLMNEWLLIGPAYCPSIILQQLGNLFISGSLKAKVLVTQSCPTLCNPMNCSSPSSSVQGILQARILEWVAILFSRGSFWPRD